MSKEQKENRAQPNLQNPVNPQQFFNPDRAVLHIVQTAIQEFEAAQTIEDQVRNIFTSAYCGNNN